MPYRGKGLKQLKDDLAALTKGHEATYDAYDKGWHMTRARKLREELKSRRQVSIWMLLFLTRKPQETL